MKYIKGIKEFKATKFLKLPTQLVGYDFRTIEEFFDINNIDENEIEFNCLENYLSEYYNYNWQWNGILERPMGGHISYVLHPLQETLHSHNSKTFVTRIQNILKDFIVEIKSTETVFGKDILTIELKQDNPLAGIKETGGNTLKDCGLSNMFYNLLEFYLYYITDIYEKEDKNIIVRIEPAYTTCISKDIKDNGNVVYHVTERENLDKILKCGIRPRVGKVKKDGGYRYFPERIYFVGKLKRHVQNLGNLYKLIKMLNIKDPVVLEVNLGEHDVDFWKDLAADDIELACYTHTAIPKWFVKKVYYNLEDIK